MPEYIKSSENTSHAFGRPPRASMQAPLSRILQAYSNVLSKQNLQREEQPNDTGIPDALKTDIDNSQTPVQMNALAYAQGTDIQIAPGQEKHLPHEAWHVVRQKKERVQPTMQLQGIPVNMNEALEKEADVMRESVAQRKTPSAPLKNKPIATPTIQAVLDPKLQIFLTNHAQEIRRDMDNPPPGVRHAWDAMRQHLIQSGIPEPRTNLIKEAIQFINQLVAPSLPTHEKEQASQFPHKGKHLATRKGAEDTKALCKKTERGSATYLSRDTPEIMELETNAINEGLKITEGIFIHIFNKNIGASHGQMTKCIRIDGNHGRPIEEDGSKTSFTGYIQRAIDDAVAVKDKARIQEILAYLAKTQYHIDFFKRSIPPALLPI